MIGQAFLGVESGAGEGDFSARKQLEALGTGAVTHSAGSAT